MCGPQCGNATSRWAAAGESGPQAPPIWDPLGPEQETNSVKAEAVEEEVAEPEQETKAVKAEAVEEEVAEALVVGSRGGDFLGDRCPSRCVPCAPAVPPFVSWRSHAPARQCKCVGVGVGEGTVCPDGAVAVFREAPVIGVLWYVFRFECVCECV